MAFSTTERVGHAMLSAWKWALSYVVSDWELQHYPVVVRRQHVPDEPVLLAPRFEPQPFRAFILGIHVSCGGTSADDAKARLAVQFNLWKQAQIAGGKPLPRPGTTVPIEVADSTKVEAHGALAADFIHRVLLLDWALITDESSLWDFHAERDNTLLQARVKDVYGVDVSDIASGNLGLILDRIAAHRLERELALR